MILKIVRDNHFINSILRRVVRTVVRFAKKAGFLADKYRVYGKVELMIQDVQIKMYSEADDFIVNDIYYGKAYEISEFKIVKSLTKKSKFFVDIGANTGIFSVFARCANKDIQVISVEPHPGNFKRLLKNASLNDIHLQSFEVASGNSDEIIRFTIPSNDSLSPISSANNAFTSNFSTIPSKIIHVNQRTLDSILESYPISNKDLIKIDVEYYEPTVLAGATRILSTAKPFILLEILDYKKLTNQFPDMKSTIREDHASEIERILSSFGYFAYQLQTDGVKLVPSLDGTLQNRNFLFAPVKVQHKVIPYLSLADSLETEH